MKLKRLLVANRGEIACRIIRAAKKLGLETVVIKNSAEPNADYLAMADIVHDYTDEITNTPVYLDIDQLVKIGLKHNADCVHPGYGFLSENANFAQSCVNAGMTFIGPSPESIRKMGNKTVAREIALANDIPMSMGSEGNLDTVEEAVVVANKIGYPVIIKAASGGGGRGMRIAWNDEEVTKMYRVARNEAEKAFNDSSVFMEKYIQNPKHIEFQVLADQQGNTIHLGERECSIQRKHQKLLEEAPSSALSEELRARMGEVSIRIAQAADYYSAGTVEFLLDDQKNFYFMEMNTRIQVEHPVTENITGVDLIEQQIRVADGQSIPYTQEDIQLKGWAIECRINAEDVQAGFVPCPGKIDRLIFPKGKHIRVETGISQGSTIASNYDSMVAKLIVTGENRADAIKKCNEVLEATWIKGIKTTLPFFKLLMNNEKFKSGDFNTSFIEKELEVYHPECKEEEHLAAWLATKLFVQEKINDHQMNIDFNHGKNINPWLLNKRH